MAGLIYVELKPEQSLSLSIEGRRKKNYIVSA